MKRDPAKAVLTILAREGVKQRVIARYLGIQEKNVSKWKKGTKPNLEHSVKLCRKYPYVRKYLGLE